MKYFLTLLMGALLFSNQSWSQAVAQYNDSANSKDLQNKVLSQSPVIVSSINPIHQIAKFISGDDKSNYLLMNPRSSENNYQILPNVAINLTKADVVFYISDSLENNLPAALSKLKNKPKIVQLIKLPNIKIISFQPRINEQVIDAHIWLNPENAIAIANEITQTLSALYPSGAPTYQKNFAQFKIDVQNMDQRNKVELLKVRPKSFFIDLNLLAYFEDYYMPSAGVMRYDYDYELMPKDVDRINNVIKRDKVSCVVGSFQERNGTALQIANNNRIKFALLDIMGSEINYNQNGYTKMMSTLVDDLVKCTKPNQN